MEFSETTKKYWTEQDFKDLEKCGNPTELLAIAMRVIGRMPKENLGQVCGPITSGGKGNFVDNMALFNETIKRLHSDGHNVFDQMPFEDPMQSLKTKPDGKSENILIDFYQPIFKSGYIKKLYFMPDWESSKGARWEHDLANELGIEIVYL